MKNKTLIISLIFIIFCSNMLNLQVKADNKEYTSIEEQKIGYFYAEESILNLETKTIIDNRGDLHVFLRIELENDSFTIFHLYNGNITKIKTELSAGSVFETFSYDNKIILFYSYHGSFNQFDIEMYVWDLEKEQTHHIYHSSYFGDYFVYNVQSVENTFYLLFGEPVFESAMDENPTTKFKKIEVFLNGSTNIQNWFTNLLYNGIQSLIIVNGKLAVLYKYMFYPTRLIGVYIIEKQPYLSNYLTFTTDYNVYLSLFNKTTLNLVLIKGENFYTKNFQINETLSFNSFSKFQLNMYSYQDLYRFSFDSSITFLINPYPYLPKNSTNTREGLVTDLIILTYNGSSIKQQFVEMPTTSNTTAYDSKYIYFQTPTDYIVSLTKMDEKARIEKKRFLEEKIFCLSVYTNLEKINIFDTKPIIYGLSLVNYFEFVLKTHWIELTASVLFSMILIAIFYKRIIKQLKKLIAYLTRPIKSGKNIFVLISINSWIFIQSVLSLPLDLWRSNKKRAIVSILGLSILSLIVFSSSTLFTHKQNIMVQQYLESTNLEEDGRASASFSRLHNVLAARWGRITEYSPFYENFSTAAINEILSSIALKTSVLREIIYDTDYSMHMRIVFQKSNESTVRSVESYYSVSQDYQNILENILISGRLPKEQNEIIIDQTTATAFEKGINDTIVFVGADVSVAGLVEKVNMTIVGIYEKPSELALLKLCREYNLSYDLVEKISTYIGAITFNEFYLSSLKTVPVQHLILDGTVQFFYDFSLVNAKNIAQLIQDFDSLQPGYDHPVKFDLGGSWSISTELKLVLLDLVPSYSSTQFLLILLSIPVVYLALFLILETNALFATSFDEEIKILRSKGLSTFKIVYLNTVMKFIESLIATLLGLGGSILILPALLKIDKFVSFNLTIPSFSFQNIPLIFIISFLGLVVITLPLTIQMAKIKKIQANSSNKVIAFFKKLRIGNILIIASGGGIMYGGYSLFKTFSQNLSSTESQLINIFIYILGIGAMISFFGLGLLLRELHSLLMSLFSKTIWKMKKNIFTFSLVEVKSDIALFNDVFLTYLLLIGIAVPAITAPLTMQSAIHEDSYFMSGADLYINRYDKVDPNISIEIRNLPNVIEVCNVSQVDAMLEGRQLMILVVQNATSFQRAAYKPEEKYFKNWDSVIPQLDNERKMIVSSNFKFFYDIEEMKYSFNGYEMEINMEFDYFPIIYPFGSRESGGTPMVVLTQSNFEKIEDSLIIFGTFGYRLLINIDDKTEPISFSESLEDNYNIEVISSAEKENEIYFTYLPFYASITSIFIFSLFICLISIAFTSMSNPLKILQRRMEKHDILKKMGIPNKRIIQMSSFELFIVGILPGLIFGTIAGFSISVAILRILKNLRKEMLPITIQFPPLVGVIVFLVIPLAFYLIFYFTMKTQFARYQPKNLE